MDAFSTTFMQKYNNAFRARLLADQLWELNEKGGSNEDTLEGGLIKKGRLFYTWFGWQFVICMGE